MDFTLDENQQAVADLANQILADRTQPEKLKEAEDAGEWFDRDTYAELAKAGLIGIALGEDVGGGGLGVVEVGQVLEAQGRNVSPVPVWNTALAALAIDRFGSDDLRKDILPGVIDGSRILTVGIQEWHSDDYLSPAAEAEDGKKGCKITGTKIVVEFAEESDKMVLIAKDSKGEAGLYLLDLDQPEISMNKGETTRNQPVHEVVISGAVGVKLENSDLAWFVNSAIALLCAVQVGVTEIALKMAAEYTSTREQFGRPLATFQAVTHALANQYINVNGIKLPTYSALWNLDNGKDATVRVSEAKWFASHLAMDLANTTQHVHGGMGVDRDYPLHQLYALEQAHPNQPGSRHAAAAQAWGCTGCQLVKLGGHC